jgi:hypothetical protein
MEYMWANYIGYQQVQFFKNTFGKYRRLEEAESGS